jgi:hypothetical protein
MRLNKLKHFILLFFALIFSAFLFSGCAQSLIIAKPRKFIINSSLEKSVAIISLKLNNVSSKTIQELYPSSDKGKGIANHKRKRNYKSRAAR